LDFRVALNGSGHTSIDSFLLTNAGRPGFSEIGKLAIAYHLLPLDLRSDFSRGSIALDWMSFLFSNMQKGCHSVETLLPNNPISFISFNYDRTLEHLLCERIKHTYNLSYPDAWETAKQFPLIHVYGSLGAFDPNAIASRPRPAIKPTATAYKQAADAIHLMYENQGTRGNAIVSAVKDLLYRAHYVCFLGFGFDADNIAYLKLNEFCQPHKAVFATRYRVANGDWNRMKQSMAPTDMTPGEGHIDWDSLGLLQQTGAIG
jgi:hypothetical protein